MNPVLLVEDSQPIVDSLVPNLASHDLSVVHAATIKQAKKALLTQPFSLIILDINLPDGSGLELCQEIHDAFPELPVIILTARLEEDIAVEGFSKGAIDFVRKPFGLTEFMSRLRRFLDRESSKTRMLVFGNIKIDSSLRSAFIGDAPLELSPREYEILVLLVRRAGEVVKRNDILNLFEDEGELMERTIDANVSRLRRKLKSAGAEKIRVRSIYGVGYRLEEI